MAAVISVMKADGVVEDAPRRADADVGLVSRPPPNERDEDDADRHRRQQHDERQIEVEYAHAATLPR